MQDVAGLRERASSRALVTTDNQSKAVKEYDFSLLLW